MQAYIQSYEYFLTYPDGRFFNYVVVACSASKARLGAPFEHVVMERKTLGIWVVVIDTLALFIFVIFIWYLQYFIRLNSMKHEKISLSTQDFSLAFTNLPPFSESLDKEALRAQLQDHIINEVRVHEDSGPETISSNEIVEINFAMKTFQFSYLDHLLDIHILSQILEKNNHKNNYFPQWICKIIRCFQFNDHKLKFFGMSEKELNLEIQKSEVEYWKAK